MSLERRKFSYYDPSCTFKCEISCDQATADANLALRAGWSMFPDVDVPQSMRVVGGALEPIPPAPPPAETLAQAKARKVAQIQAEGVALARGRFPAITNFDLLQLVQQLMLSVAPAARAPTTDMTWLSQVWTAGSNARASVKSATTIAQVDAVAPAWPPP